MRTVSVKKSVFARIFSDRFVKSAFNVSIGTIRAKYFLEFIKTFSNMERKFQLFVIFFSGCVKTTTYIRRWTVRWKRTIRKTYYGLIIFGQKAKNFWPSGNCFSIELSKLRANIYVEKFEGKNEKVNFFVFFGIWTESFWPFVDFSSGICENCLLLVHGISLNKLFFWTKNLYFIKFAQRANSSGVFLELFRRGSEKCFIGVHKNVFLGGEGESAEKVQVLWLFLDLVPKLLGLLTTFFDKSGSKFHLTCPQQHFQKFSPLKVFLFSSNCFIERNFFCRNFSSGFVKCGFQVSAGKFWWQGYFLKKNFNIFGLGPNTSRFCVAIFPVELTKLHYTCSIKNFQREVFQKNC